VSFDRSGLVAFYTSVCVLVVCVEASESPHDVDNYSEVGDPTVRNCESLASAMAHYLQEAQPPPPSAPPTPAAAMTTPAAARSNRGAISGRPGWEALANGCLLHKGDLTEYVPSPPHACHRRTCPLAQPTLSNILSYPTQPRADISFAAKIVRYVRRKEGMMKTPIPPCTTISVTVT
jgi:hypothetical protein